MKAVIPVAGFGTRIEHIANGKPKALLAIKGRPLIDYTIDKLNAMPDISEIIMITNAKHFDQFSAWKSTVKSRLPITLLNNGVLSNETRKGAIKDIVACLQKPEDVLVIFGDNYFTVDLKNIFSLFKEKGKDVIGAYDVHSLDQARKLGNVEVNTDRQVTKFIEKPPEPKSTLAATGMYILKKDTTALLMNYSQDQSMNHDAPGFFIQWLYQKTPIFTYIIDGITEHWYDVGSEEIYNQVK